MLISKSSTLLIAISYGVILCCCLGVEVEWSAISLRPHYHEDFNESSPYFEIRTMQPIRLDKSNVNDPHPLCVFDLLEIEWTYSKEVRQIDSLQHVSLALALPGLYEDILATPIGSFYQTLTINPGRISISNSVVDGNAEVENDHHVFTNMENADLLTDRQAESKGKSEQMSQQHIVSDKQVHSDGTIFCSSAYNVFCRPSTQGINLLQDIGVLIVNFDRDTNMPLFDSNEDILHALDILPVPTHKVIAEWRNPKQLLLQLNESDVKNIVTAHHAGEPVRVLIKESHPRQFIGLSGKKTLRVSEVGNLHLFVVNSKTGEVLSNLWQLKVAFCSSEELLPSILMRDNHQHLKEHLEHNRPIFNQNGVVAVTGKHPIVIGDAAFPIMTTGSWSISFWIRLLEIPTGSYRCLLYKGNSDNTQRTPSVWLLPDSNKFTLRVSTIENADAGITSNAELPMNKWTMLTFVFQNDSSSSINESMKKDEKIETLSGQNILHEGKKSNEMSPFRVEVYVDGQLDLSAQFLQTVLANNGNLRLFRDPSFFGPKSFVQGIKLWEAAISKSIVQRLYGMGPSAVGTRAVDETIDMLQSANNPLLPFLSNDDLVNNPLDPELVAAYKRQASLNHAIDGESTSVLSVSATAAMNGLLVETTERRLKPMSKSIVDMVIKKSKESIINCEPYEARLDMHLESAELGAIEGTYHWARLLMYGFETADSQCGFSAVSSDIKRKNTKKVVDPTDRTENTPLSEIELSIEEIEPFARDSAKAIHGFVKAVELGHVSGIVPLAFALIHGIGLESLVHYQRPLASNWDIPDTSFSVDAQKLTDSLGNNKLRNVLGAHLVKDFIHCHTTMPSSESSIISLSDSVLCNKYYRRKASSSSENTIEEPKNSTLSNDLALGLLFIAALHNDAEAQVALSYRYEYGLGGVAKDIETALLYLTNPTMVASDAFQAYGAQPIVETDRINDQTVRDVAKGHQGNDDEMIQYQIVRAKEGDVGAMLAMGDLYYYGARGLPRDQAQALQYYTQAANAGDPSGMCGAANMYLKGEGAPVNVSKAIELYEYATANGSVRAYNGLGYLYFYGNQVEKNETKAFQYFLLAASFENDGDALFNAGYCLEHGIGITANLSRAIYYYSLGAQKTGHFQSIKTMGQFTLEGKGIARSAETALMYFNVAKSIGPWASWLRRGFDLFLTTTDKIYGNMDDIYMRSLFCYLYAGELGYEVAQSNAAYILRAKLAHVVTALDPSPAATNQKLLPNGDMSTMVPTYSSMTSLQKLQLREYAMSGMIHNYAESYFHLGNCFFTGKCGLMERNYENAIFYYHLASYAKNGLASAYLGVMYHFNIGVSDRNPENNMIRANRYYEEALASGSIDSIQLRTMIQMLQKMLSWKKSSSFSLFNSVHYSLDYVIKALWAA